MSSHRSTATAVCVVVCASAIAVAQTIPTKVTGSFTVTSELYSVKGIDARRPSGVYRAILSPTVTLFDQIVLPFEVFVSSEERGFRQPFNQFGASPRLWGWLTLHAGYFSTTLSELTFGDTRLMGGGIEAVPGKFRFAIFYGRSQQAVAGDTTRGVRGVFERWMEGVKLGYGIDGELSVDLSVIHAKDNQGSLQNPPLGVASDSVVSEFSVQPTENLVASLAYRIPIGGSSFDLAGETAVAAYTNDTRSPEYGSVSSSLRSIFNPRTSTQYDAASTLALNIVPWDPLTVKLAAKWIGPGFVTLGYAQMPNDILEFTLSPAYRHAGGTFSIRPSIGLRYNNLRNNRTSTTRRTIVNVAATAQPSDLFGLDLQYSNYGMRSNPRNDTLRIDNISQMFMASPRLTFPAFAGMSTAVLTYTFQNYTDYNVVTSALSANRTQSGVVMYSLYYPSSLSLTTSLMYMASTTSLVGVIVRNVSETIGYAFFDQRLMTTATVGYNVVSSSSTDKQIMARLSASYNTMGWGTFTITLSSNAYDYGNADVAKSYSEYQGTLLYSVSL